MWQKCPICDGSGEILSSPPTTSVKQKCPVCNGTRIISELNGLPPTPTPEKYLETSEQKWREGYMDAANAIGCAPIPILK